MKVPETPSTIVTLKFETLLEAIYVSHHQHYNVLGKRAKFLVLNKMSLARFMFETKQSSIWHGEFYKEQPTILGMAVVTLEENGENDFFKLGY